MKKKLKIINVGLTVLAVALLSLPIHARELPGDWNPAPQFGSAYSSNAHNIKALKCVKATILPAGQVVSKVKYNTEANFETLASAFGGSLSTNLDVPFVRANASLKYAKENASTDKRINWYYAYSATKSEKMDVDDLRISQTGKEARRSQKVAQICGDEFIYQIDYGATLLATMSIEFASIEDKMAFQASVDVDVDFGIGSAGVNGSMSKMNQRMGSRTKVKVDVHQTGGNSGELTAIVPGKIVYCNLANMDKCLEAFGNIINYAQNNLRQQLANGLGYSVVRYHTIPYAGSAAFDLESGDDDPLLQATLQRKRKQIQGNYETEAMVYDRADYIKSKLRHFTPAEQIRRVEEIYNRAFANMTKLTDAMNLCLEYPDQRCINQEIDLQVYDCNHLEIKIVEQLDPNGPLGKLHKAVMDDDVDTAYQSIRFGGNQLITECDHQGYNVCHKAAQQGRPRLLSLIIEEDPYKDVADKSIVRIPCDNARKYTPLHLAAEGGTSEHARCMDILCAAGAGIDCKTADGLTPLQIAVSCGKMETIVKLISQGADAHIRGREESTLLHLAAHAGNVEVIDYLIETRKLNVNAHDNNLMTPLHWAARAGNFHAVLRLLNHGANHRAQDSQQRMALHWGINNKEITDKLIQLYDFSLVVSTMDLPEHPSGNNCFNHSGSLLVLPSGDNFLSIWNVVKNSPHFILPVKGRINSVAFSPNDQLMATSNNFYELSIWDTNSWALKNTLGGHSSWSPTLAFAPNGSMLISGNHDKTIKFWDVHKGTVVQTLIGEGGIREMKLSPSVKVLASVEGSKDIKIWNVESGQLEKKLSGHNGITGAIAFNADGKLLASGSEDQTVRIWDTQTWLAIQTLENLRNNIQALAFSPDNSILAVSDYYTFKFYNTKSWKLVYEFSEFEGSNKAISFSDDGMYFVMPIRNKTNISVHYKYQTALMKLRFDSILHFAVKGENLSVVKMLVEKFPLLPLIRTPHGKLPLELAEELLLGQGNNQNPELEQIVAFLAQ